MAAPAGRTKVDESGHVVNLLHWHPSDAPQGVQPHHLPDPDRGPIASIVNATPQPNAPDTSTVSHIENAVSRNPTDVCSVSAVPTACGGATSVTSAENCAESATIAKPQTSASSTRRDVGRNVSEPMTSGQAATEDCLQYRVHSTRFR